MNRPFKASKNSPNLYRIERQNRLMQVECRS
jgi:hypothetical protein